MSYGNMFLAKNLELYLPIQLLQGFIALDTFMLMAYFTVHVVLCYVVSVVRCESMTRATGRPRYGTRRGRGRVNISSKSLRHTQLLEIIP